VRRLAAFAITLTFRPRLSCWSFRWRPPISSAPMLRLRTLRAASISPQLLNCRTTLITRTATPLSVVVTALVFKWFGMSINTTTLGGLAVSLRLKAA
jgi:hypothetical protein